MSTEIMKAENIQLIVQDAPNAFSENKISHDRCIAFGNRLLAKIQETGMTDELDQEAASYINSSRATIKKMQVKRSPLTKLFDEIRGNFTTYENDIDPTKDNTVPYKLQQLRNQYAAQKRAEEERKRNELVMQQQKQAKKNQYKADCEDFYFRKANMEICEASNRIVSLFSSVTLDNYDERLNAIRSVEYSEQQMSFGEPNVMKPGIVPVEELTDILNDVKNKYLPQMKQKMAELLTETRQQYIDLMPSKKSELERAAQASAEEAEIIRQQILMREAQEKERKENELREAQEKERREAEAKKQADAMGGLFDGVAAGMPAYAPKASVKKRLVPLNVEAFPEIISMWWQGEGKNMSVSELTKMFKKQISYCEKLAKEGEIIKSEHICYEDEVKAK